jgi:drug/metabolite transporter (DMT)-like permease
LLTDAALAALILIWAANFSVAKFALSDFAPLSFNGLRFLLASVVMFFFMRASGRKLPRFDRRHWPLLVALGVLGHIIYQVLFIFGLDWTLAGNASLMLAMSPVFIAVLSVAARQERVGRIAAAGVLVSFVGVALVVLGGARAVRFGASTVRGDLMVLAAAGGWASYTVGSAPLVRRYGSLPVTAVTMWIGGLGLVSISIPSFLAQEWGDVRPSAWMALFYSGIFAIGVAYLLWYQSVRRLGSTRTGVYSNLIPIIAVLIAWVTLGETPTWMQALGAVGIVAGAVLARLGMVTRRSSGLPLE